MKSTVVVTLIIGLAVVGCAAPPPQPKIKLHTLFNKQQAAQLMAAGANTIKGSALMRQVGGGVVTCAGQTVSLYPATTYAYERIRHLYGSDTVGMRSAVAFQRNPDPFTETDPDYRDFQKSTICDAQGFFKFEKIADGEFFLTSSITWRANPNSIFPEGGVLMRRVKVNGGETKELVLAP